MQIDVHVHPTKQLWETHATDSLIILNSQSEFQAVQTAIIAETYAPCDVYWCFEPSNSSVFATVSFSLFLLNGWILLPAERTSGDQSAI